MAADDTILTGTPASIVGAGGQELHLLIETGGLGPSVDEVRDELRDVQRGSGRRGRVMAGRCRACVASLPESGDERASRHPCDSRGVCR